jgi:DNA-binding NtrC family response regulator
MRSRPPQAVQASAANGQPEQKLDDPSSNRPQSGTASPVPQSPTSASNVEVARARHVLLVDDDQSVVRSLSRILRARGYLTSTASNGEEAVRLVTQVDFDAILTDIAMPGMDGIALLREIRNHDLHVPVILVTGEPAVDTAVQALEYGALHYLTKPVPMDALERVLDKAVHLHRMAHVRQRASELLG